MDALGPAPACLVVGKTHDFSIVSSHTPPSPSSSQSLVLTLLHRRPVHCKPAIYNALTRLLLSSQYLGILSAMLAAIPLLAFVSLAYGIFPRVPLSSSARPSALYSRFTHIQRLSATYADEEHPPLNVAYYFYQYIDHNEIRLGTFKQQALVGLVGVLQTRCVS